MLSEAFQTCQPLQSLGDIEALLHTAQAPWYLLAEGNYPFPSTYIPCTYRLPLPDSSQFSGTRSRVSALRRARMLSVNLALVVHSARSAF